MKNKTVFLFLAIISFILTGVVFWYGSMSVAKRIDMVTMRARFDAAQNATSSGRRQAAAVASRLALVEYQKGSEKPGYYIDIAGDFLTAGNCLWQQGKRRAALAAYEQGLRNDPHSISLLTSAGLCSLQLGEFDLAGNYLTHSQKIYPGDERVNRALSRLKARLQGNKG